MALENPSAGASSAKRVQPKNLHLREADCPGLLDFLATLPRGTHTALFRGIINMWFTEHRAAGDLEAAAQAAIARGFFGATNGTEPRSPMRAPPTVSNSAVSKGVGQPPVPVAVDGAVKAGEPLSVPEAQPLSASSVETSDGTGRMDLTDSDDLLLCLEHANLFEQS